MSSVGLERRGTGSDLVERPETDIGHSTGRIGESPDKLNRSVAIIPNQKSVAPKFWVYARNCGCKVERIGDLAVGFSEAWQDKRMAET